MDTVAGYFESLTRIRENPQCPCFRRSEHARYPAINQDRSLGRRRHGAPPPREPSDTVRRPGICSHSIHVHGAPGARRGEIQPLEETLGRPSLSSNLLR